MDLNVYAALTPLLLLLMTVEFAYCLHADNGYYNFADSVANLGTAVANQVFSVLVGYGVLAGYDHIHRHFGLAELGGATAGLFLFVGIDFLFYWFHRAGHEFHIMWAAHSPHHSSEELNYTVAARASLTQRMASFLFYAPLAFFFRAETLVPAILVHHVLQFWPHTRAIKRLPAWFERWFNAPSHHRVHHGINDIYLDKNYGGVLIVWDKLFGTFEPEVEEVIYGVRPPIRSWDPVEINLDYYKKLWRWAKATPYWSDRLKLPFMRLDWRPRGVEKPVGPSWVKEGHVKAALRVPKHVKVALLAQIPVALALMMLATRHDSPLGLAGKIAAGAGVWALVLLWGRQLEALSPYALYRAVMTVPTCLPASALVKRPRLSPFTTWMDRMWWALRRFSSTDHSTTLS